MRQVVDVGQDELLVVLELFEPQLEYVGGDLLVLGAVVLHEGGGGVGVVPRAPVLTGLLEDGASGRRALCPTAELHVLDVALPGGERRII